MSRISQKQTQKLLQKLSPQQIQMIKLLELPSLRLEERIKQEIEENPILEEDSTQESKEEQSDTKVDEQRDQTLDDYLSEDDIPNYKYYSNNYSKDDTTPNYNVTVGRSLGEYLKLQVGYRNLTPHQTVVANYIIGSIDNDGYLRRDLSSIEYDIAFSLGVETTQEELEYLLGIIQELEPAGIGARSLQETLLIQLKRSGVDSAEKEIALKIVESYFEEFSRKHYERLISRLGVSVDEFRDAVARITALTPKPGSLYSGDDEDSLPYVIPDFILDNRDGEYELRLNNSNIPQVRISRQYVDMIREMASPSGEAKRERDQEAVQFVRNKIESAKWFISAIKQRQDTLMRTMTEILHYQKEYFESGELSSLRPMILKDIAERTNLDVSTISRVVNSKYIQTQFGVIPLKQLFSEGMQTDSGEEVSSYEIKEILEKSIEEEDKNKPMTDEALVNMLNEKGYRIARRTVAKYREMLSIPVARLRREI